MRRAQGDTDDFGRASHAQLHGCALRQGDDGVVQRPGLATTNLQDQFGHALNRLRRQCKINPALVAVPRIGGKIKAARASGDGIGLPKRCFDIHILRAVAHGSSRAAHDAGERFDLRLVGDHAHALVQRDGVAVEQSQAFTVFGPAHRQVALNFVQVKHVAGLAQLKHHKVRNIHQSADRTLAAAGEFLHHPVRRRRSRIHAAHDTACKAAA